VSPGNESSPGSASRFCLRLVFLALFSIFPFAADAAVDLPEETVSAGAVDERFEDRYRSPGSVTVIRPADREGEQRTLPDLLEEVPGLRVIRLHGRHGYAVASVRGSTSAQVAVYVDGTLINLQSEAAVDLSAIPVDSVERIEVYKGYIPSRFGAQAMGGVINIVTKMPRKPEINISLGTGSFGLYKGSASYSSPLGGGKFFGAAGYETYGGDFEYWNDNFTPVYSGDDYTGRRRNNGFENADILLKWEDEHWRTRASWVRRDRGLAIGARGFDRQDSSPQQYPKLYTDRWDFSAGRSQVSGSVEWGWDVLYTRQNKEYDSGRGTTLSLIGVGEVTESEYTASRAGVSAFANWAAGERHFFELYADYFGETLEVDGDMVFEYLGGIGDYDRTDVSVSLQDSIALDRAGSFIATPSLRWHSLDGEDHFTWQMALTKEFSPNLMLKTAFGTYARAPNLYERYGDGAFILPSKKSNSGEPELQWETGKQLDASVIWAPPVFREVSSNVSLSAFWRESENLIEFDMESPVRGVYKNIAEAAVKGAELEASLSWRKWNMTFSGTWMDGENRSPDEGSVRQYGLKLPNRPELSWNARLTREFQIPGHGRGSVFAEYRHVGENYVDKSEKVLFAARNIWNIGAKYAFSESTELVVGVNDLTDESDGWRMYPNGRSGATRMLDYPVEGRSYYMTLNMKF
jgi:outer membrane cobalamin receptor